LRVFERAFRHGGGLVYFGHFKNGIVATYSVVYIYDIYKAQYTQHMSLQEIVNERKRAMVQSVLEYEHTRSNKQLSYDERREALDGMRSHRFTLKARKGGVQIPYSEVDQHDKISHHSISKSRMMQVRKELIRTFNIASGVDILNYRSLNQGEEGACSFVAFMTLSRLGGKKLPRTHWRTAWNKIQRCTETDEEGTTDIGETLDLLPASYDTSGLIYLPLRSRGNRELIAHPLLTVNPLGKHLYAEDIIVNLAALVEGLIDAGYPVEINFNAHSRVAVGYNDESILFADTWGDLHFEERLNRAGRQVDLYEGGFSKVPKWNVYSFSRDLCFFADATRASARAPTGASARAAGQASSKTTSRNVRRQASRRPAAAAATGIAPIDTVLGFVGSLFEPKPEIQEVDRLPKSKKDFQKYGLQVGQQYKSRRGRKVYTVTEKDLRAVPIFKQFTDLHI